MTNYPSSFKSAQALPIGRRTLELSVELLVDGVCPAVFEPFDAAVTSGFGRHHYDIF